MCFVLSEPIGGPGSVVEIDESMFGKRKYNRGKMRKGVWVFGGVERGSNRCFLVPVKNRKASTLIPIIKHFILPGTLILSDCWMAYSKLNLEGYEHQTVNHSRFYKDPVTGVHTNTVEGMWAHAKRDFIKGGRPKRHMYGYLATFMLKRKLAGEPGKTFVDFIKMAHDCVEVGYPEGDHHLHIPEAHPELDDSSGSEPDDDIDDFRELLMEWVGGEEDIFTFPDTFSLAERRQIHNICDQLKLVHKSTGEGDSRRLVVTRVPITPDGVICVIPSVTPTSDFPDRSVNHSPTAPVLAIEYPQADDRHVPPPTNIEPRASKRQKKLPTHLAIYQL
ncbi:uncharacterized protein LOC124337679 [Daphnia pulicaria]|uniref:uncharacterized protein LOC124337679 n=1 Tax=Daphnia pulicaria TaxID=35523 RepID=UPI001EE9DE77|nr:uncharacterized protein LOC124337679 [Daphnia pulicaria]